MKAPSSKTLCSAALALALAACLPACQGTREAAESEGGSRLDPTTAASRAKLNSAQRVFGSSGTGAVTYGGGDIKMKSFRSGGAEVAMPGFATKSVQMKSLANMPSFEPGAEVSEMSSKSFAGGMSPFQTRTSGFSNQAAEVGRSRFATKSYRTRTYRGSGRGFRLPSDRAPKVTPADTLMDTSAPQAASVSVGDIRTLLNR